MLPGLITSSTGPHNALLNFFFLLCVSFPLKENDEPLRGTVSLIGPNSFQQMKAAADVFQMHL